MTTTGIKTYLYQPVKLPDGDYDGCWSGNEVTILIQDKVVKITTSNPSLHIKPCLVIVSGEDIEIRSVELLNDNCTR